MLTAQSKFLLSSGRILFVVSRRSLSKMYAPPDKGYLAQVNSGLAGKRIDLRSDTLTKPTDVMRKASFEADIGDDTLGEDPTINSFQERVAKLFGKERAIFLTSGTMGNLVAILSHCSTRGQYALVGDKSHIVMYEGGGAAELGGVTLHTTPMNVDGTFNLHDVEQRMNGLVCVENTFNGRILPLKYLQELQTLVKSRGGTLHMDGARVFNAAVKLGVPIEHIVRYCDSVTFCLSKGLGCPVGSVLVGSKSFIERAHRLRHVLGGQMRQAGVLAAYGHVALDSMVDRLADDHRRMAEIVKAIQDSSSHSITAEYSALHTNIGIIKINPKCGTGEDLRIRLATVTAEERRNLAESAVSIQCWAVSADSIRFIAYTDITDEDVYHVKRKLSYVISEYDKATEQIENGMMSAKIN